MRIKDKNNNLLAQIIRFKEIKKDKNFVTSNDDELQLGSFNLSKGTEIKRHIHPNQKREINITTEVIVVISGEIQVDLYDNDYDFVKSVNVFEGDAISLVGGGHGLTVKKNTKFIEVKQGPYTDSEDKIRF